MTDPVAQYSIIDMNEALRQRVRPQTFLKDYLIKPMVKQHRTKYISLDKVFGNRVRAGYVNRQSKGHVVGKGDFNNVIHVAPYVKELFDYGPSDVDQRLPGYNPYEQGPDAIQALIAAASVDLDDRFVRLEESQIASALINGTLSISGDDVDYTIDFGMRSAHKITLSGTARWTESSTRNILKNFQTWSGLPSKQGAPRPSWALLGLEAADIVQNDTAILNLLDNRRTEIGAIRFEQFEDQNATYIGHISGAGFSLDLYTYQGMDDVVTNGTPVETKYIDDYRCILGNSSMVTKMHYGKIENLKAPNFTGTRFINQWVEDDGSAGHFSIESSPMFGLHQADAVVSVNVTSGS